MQQQPIPTNNIHQNTPTTVNNPPVGGSTDEFNNWLTLMATTNQQPVQTSPIIPEKIATFRTKNKEQAVSNLRTPDISWNPLVNAKLDAQEIGTGITGLVTNFPAVAHSAWEYFDTPGQKPYKDIINAVLSPYNTTVDDFGTLPAKDIALNVISGAYRHPVSTALDVASLGGFRLLGNLMPWTKAATAVERGSNAARADVASRGAKIYDKLAEANKIAKETGADYAKAIEALEEGKTVTGAEKQIFKLLKGVSDDMDALYKDYSPTTYVNQERMAITQKILRDRLKVNPESTFAQVERDILPLYERVAAGELDAVKQLAKEGNITAKEIVGAKALYDKGRIKPITHGLANVEKVVGEQVQRLGSNVPGIFTRRAYGTSNYEDIVKQLKKPDQFLEEALNATVDKAIAKDILNSNIGGQSIKSNLPKDNVFLNRELLERGDLRGALTELRKKQVLDTDVPINRWIAKSLKDQLDMGGAFDGVVKDLYNTGKGVQLASGTYLGPNFVTGLANALVNSNINIVGDILDAIKSGGKISQQLGTFRRANLPQYSNIPGVREIQKLNRYTGGKFMQGVDRLIQNSFSEIAANAELRKRGISFSDRLNPAQQLSKQQLGELITDVNRMALINSRNIPLPKLVKDIAFVANPFWRWQVTAAQSSLRLLEKNPFLANTVLLDVLGRVGFDKEMQNRLNLNITLNRPYTSYRFNPYTGKTEELNVETVPIMTTLKLFAPDKDNRFPYTSPVLTSIINAMGGTDKYGRPLRRPTQDGVITQTVGTKRYKSNPKTGMLEEIQGGYGDEILTASIKELVGLPTLVNRTLGPLASYFVSEGQFFQPYGNSLLGSFSRDTTQSEGNLLQGGDPLRGRSATQVIDALRGVYASPYYESRDEQGRPLPQRTQRQIYKNIARDRMKTYGY